MPPSDFWIAEIRISDSVEHKIRHRRGVTGDQVREACIPNRGIARWEDHPVHGRRLLIIGSTQAGVNLKIVLRPVDAREGIWRLCTVIRDTGTHGRR